MTTKVDDHGVDETHTASTRSLTPLGADYVDLHLVRWPVPSRDHYQALERLQQGGAARSIGVSNFAIEHMQRLFDTTSVVPAINLGRAAPAAPARRAAHLELGTQHHAGVVVIPQSVAPERIRDNLDVFGFSLDQADFDALRSLAAGERTGRDPRRD